MRRTLDGRRGWLVAGWLLLGTAAQSREMASPVVGRAQVPTSQQGTFEKLNRAAEDARLSRAMFRCTTLFELVSCGDALNMKPNDPLLLLAEADTLMQLQRPGEAIGVYRNLLTLPSNHETVNARIAAADVSRRAFVDICETRDGKPGLAACEAAWLPNAPDEARVIKRRAQLLQADHQPDAALAAYLAAARLRPADRGVAAAIVSLTAVAGRQKADELAARGAALLTLDRAPEAIGPLRQALELEPGLGKAKSDLRLAQLEVANARSAAALRETASAGSSAFVAADSSASSDPGERRFSNDAPVTRSN